MIGFYPDGAPAVTLRQKILLAFFGKHPSPPEWCLRKPPKIYFTGAFYFPEKKKR